MAKYRVMEKSFINNALVEEGTEIEFDGEPGPNLQPLSKKRSAASSDSTTPADAGTGGNTDPLV
jgi:hypothetical protein